MTSPHLLPARGCLICGNLSTYRTVRVKLCNFGKMKRGKNSPNRTSTDNLPTTTLSSLLLLNALSCSLFYWVFRQKEEYSSAPIVRREKADLSRIMSSVIPPARRASFVMKISPWVMLAGCSIIDSTPPSDSASWISFTFCNRLSAWPLRLNLSIFSYMTTT